MKESTSLSRSIGEYRLGQKMKWVGQLLKTLTIITRNLGDRRTKQSEALREFEPSNHKARSGMRTVTVM